jgi:hypothetical protein
MASSISMYWYNCCDQSESQLTTTQTESRRLLESILHETPNPPEAVPV